VAANFPLLVSAPTRYKVQIILMLKHTEKKQDYLSEKQFVSNLKIRGIILSLVKTPTKGRHPNAMRIELNALFNIHSF